MASITRLYTSDTAMHALTCVLLALALFVFSQQAMATTTKCWSCGGIDPPCKMNTTSAPIKKCANNYTVECGEHFGKVVDCGGICIIKVHLKRNVVHSVTRGCTDQRDVGSVSIRRIHDERKEMICDYSYCNAEVSGNSINRQRPKNAANGKPVGLFLIIVSAAMVLRGVL